MTVSPTLLHTRGGETLRIHFEQSEDGFHSVYLEGEARVIYEGRLWNEAV